MNEYLKTFTELNIIAAPGLIISLVFLVILTSGMTIPYNVVIKEQSSFNESPYSSYEEIPAMIPLSLIWVGGIECILMYSATQQQNQKEKHIAVINSDAIKRKEYIIEMLFICSFIITGIIISSVFK